LNELYISWELIDKRQVENITVYNLNGSLLQTLSDMKSDTINTIPFGNYPSGMYVVVLNFNDGKGKSIKVEKK
jgi:hypothetical protein